MTIPILNTTPGKCIACGGPLVEGHNHSYQDDSLMAFYDEMMANLMRNGCMLIGQDGTIYQGHPRLKSGYMWMPMEITNIGPHDTCDIKVPHHHCK